MLRRLATLSTLVLPWLLGACPGSGPCDFQPAWCVLKDLQLDPKTIARSQLSTEFPIKVTTGQSWPVDHFVLNLYGKLVASDKVLKLADIDESNPASAYEPSLFRVREDLKPGTYTFKIAHPDRDLELADGQPDPTLTITDDPVKLSWAVPKQLTIDKPSDADLTRGSVLVRGVWVGRPNDTNLAEVLLLRDYTNWAGVTKTQLSRIDTRQTWPILASVQDFPFFFGLWPFGSEADPFALCLTKGHSSHFVSAAPLKDTSNPTSVDLKATASAMAVAKFTSGTLGLLVKSDSGLNGYVRNPSSITGPTPVMSMPSCAPKYLVGFADDPAGTTGVGVMGMTEQGETCFFDFDGTKFTENTTKLANLGPALQTTTGMVKALAVGDVNGDGRNDIAVARNAQVEFYLNQWWGFVPAAAPLPTGVDPVAIAIGQMDGMGKNDLLVADGKQQMCGTSPCNHVYVYSSNQTQ